MGPLDNPPSRQPGWSVLVLIVGAVLGALGDLTSGVGVAIVGAGVLAAAAAAATDRSETGSESRLMFVAGTLTVTAGLFLGYEISDQAWWGAAAGGVVLGLAGALLSAPIGMRMMGQQRQANYESIQLTQAQMDAEMRAGMYGPLTPEQKARLFPEERHPQAAELADTDGSESVETEGDDSEDRPVEPVPDGAQTDLLELVESAGDSSGDSGPSDPSVEDHAAYAAMVRDSFHESEASAQDPAGPDRVPCPFCAESIKREAVLCRFCGSQLATDTDEDIPF